MLRAENSLRGIIKIRDHDLKGRHLIRISSYPWMINSDRCVDFSLSALWHESRAARDI